MATRKRTLIAATVIALLGFATWSSSVGAAFYVGGKPGKWRAEAEIENGFIRSMRLTVPSNCRDQETPPGLNLTVELGKKLRIRRHGGFYRETVTRWSKSVLKGRLIGNRIKGSLWFADFGDYVQCWTGTGEKPAWVPFAARAVRAHS